MQSIVKTGSYSLGMKLKMQKVSRWTDAGHTLIRKVHSALAQVSYKGQIGSDEQ